MYDITTLVSTLLLLSLSLTCLYAHSGPYFFGNSKVARDFLQWYGNFYGGMGLFLVVRE